ncbi:MAG: TIGR03086 family protein [Sporichthyaceae bacterium]|nr:TIGR03086 family protein [Sporichthyaceae bacterium]
MDVLALHARSAELWLDRVRTVTDDQLGAATPCSEWDVRALLNHVVGEDRWTAPLVEGQTIEEVGDRFDGDLLGVSPGDAAEEAGKEAVAAFAEPGAGERTVHLSFGDTPAQEYAWQLTADHLVHAWDLAVATGGDTRLDDELVRAVARWFADWEELMRGGGAIGPRPETSATSDQDRLLVAFGRDPGWRGIGPPG